MANESPGTGGTIEGEMNCLLAWQAMLRDKVSPDLKRRIDEAGEEEALYGVFKLGWAQAVDFVFAMLRERGAVSAPGVVRYADFVDQVVEDARERARSQFQGEVLAGFVRDLLVDHGNPDGWVKPWEDESAGEGNDEEEER